MKKNIYFAITIVVFFVAGCGGSRGKSNTSPEVPKPPVDEDILNLVPFETDVVLWIDLKTLRTSPAFGIVENVLNSGSIKLPEEQAIKNPLLTCNEIALAFFESEEKGNQLLVILKGDEANIGNILSSFDQNEKAEPVQLGGYNGLRTPDLFLLSYTKHTIAFGNEAIVRMSVKTTTGDGRSIRVNPKFASFDKGGGAVAKLRYRSGVVTPVFDGIKSVVPRINADAITSVDAEARAGEGLSAKIVVETATQMDASVMARDLERARNNLGKNMFVLLLGIGWMLDRIEIASDKTSINIGVTFDGRDLDELKQLVDRLQKIRELLNNIDDGKLLREGSGKQP